MRWCFIFVKYLAIKRWNCSEHYQKQQNLDILFGPSSPPSFLDAEQLMSPTSRNIWGSPLQESLYSQRETHVNNIQSLFDFAKLANAVRLLPSIPFFYSFAGRPVCVCFFFLSVHITCTGVPPVCSVCFSWSMWSVLVEETQICVREPWGGNTVQLGHPSHSTCQHTGLNLGCR